MKRLWGEHYYSPTERKWNKEGGDGYVRGFCHFILDPIYKVSFNNFFNIFLYFIQLILSNCFQTMGKGNNSPFTMSRTGLLKTSLQPTIRISLYLTCILFFFPDQVFDAVMNFKKDEIQKLVDKLGIKLDPEEKVIPSTITAGNINNS